VAAPVKHIETYVIFLISWTAVRRECLTLLAARKNC
jgi:hypothetical protein